MWLYSWCQDQSCPALGRGRRRIPCLRCELSKCGDLSENLCARIDVILYSQHFYVVFLRGRVTYVSKAMTHCPVASIQSSCLELAIVQARSALGCFVFPMARVCLAATLRQVQVSVLLLRRVLVSLFSVTGDWAIKHKTLFWWNSKDSISLCSAVISVIPSESQKLS